MNRLYSFCIFFSDDDVDVVMRDKNAVHPLLYLLHCQTEPPYRTAFTFPDKSKGSAVHLN